MRARKRRAMRGPRRPPRTGRPAGFGAGQAAAAIARSAATFYFKGHESHGTYPLIFGDMRAGEVARRARRAPARGHGAGDRATRPEDRRARAGTVYFVASRRHAGTGPGPGPVRGSCKDATRADRQARSMAGFIRKAVFRGARNLGVKQGITAITWNESASFITYLDHFGKGYFLIAIAMAPCAEKPVTVTPGPLRRGAGSRRIGPHRLGRRGRRRRPARAPSRGSFARRTAQGPSRRSSRRPPPGRARRSGPQRPCRPPRETDGPRRLTTKVRAAWRRTATGDRTRPYDRIAARADADTAFAGTSSIEAHRADLATYPHSGTLRDAIAPGVRTLNFRGRTVIAYRVEAAAEVLRIFHAGQALGLAE